MSAAAESAPCDDYSTAVHATPKPLADVLRSALRLGLTSFGGPVAHIGYFRREYVGRRRWLDDRTFAELVVLCQSLPGPASSQLGIAIGTLRAGHLGGVAAWLGFTLPSAVLLGAFAVLTTAADVASAPWAHGLKLAAVAVVMHAVWMMRRSLAPDVPRRLVAFGAMTAALLWPSLVTPIAIIGGGAVAGLLLSRTITPDDQANRAPDDDAAGMTSIPAALTISRRSGFVALALFVMLLAGLPSLLAATGSQLVAVADTFYRAGALVFGGGHVVLPILHGSVVTTGWLDESRFVAGYGAAQTVPGPLFAFAGYLGAAVSVGPGSLAGGALALVAIFLPGMLLVWAALPFWAAIRQSRPTRGALAGSGAAVVGLLAAALYDPVWVAAVVTPGDAVLALAGFLALAAFGLPPLLVVGAAMLVTQVAPGL